MVPVDKGARKGTGGSDLREPLVDGGDALPPDFDRKEFTAMFSMAWPMMVSFFCRMAMATVDSAFVGHINTGGHHAGTYLAAAGLSDMVVNILVIPPLAFNQSLNALVSQALGSGNKKMAGTWLQLSVFWLTVTYIPCLVSFFCVEQILTMLGFDAEICALAGAYAKWNAFWPIPNGWYQCMRFYFQAQGNTRPAMYNNIFFLMMNILLNWIFVFGGPFRHWFGWEGFGFVGAAMSLSLSRSLQPLAYWLYMFKWKKAHVETWPGLSWKFLGKERNKAFLGQSLPQVGTLILQATMNQSTTLMISQLGPLAIACSTAATALTSVFTGGLSTTCTATAGIRVGYHLGQGNWRAARRAALLVFGFSGVACCCIALLLLPFRHFWTNLMTSDEHVSSVASMLLFPVMLNTFASMLVQCQTGGVFTSQGRTRLSTILSMGIELPMTLGAVAFCVFVLKWGLVPVYWGQAAVFWLEMAICLAIFVTSDWPKYAREIMARQEAAPSTQKDPSLVAGSVDATPGIVELGALAIASPGATKEYREFAPSSPGPMPTTALTIMSPNTKREGGFASPAQKSQVVHVDDL